MKLYERLSCFIDDHGIKKSYISEKTSISQSLLSMILSGKKRMFSDELEEIIIALDVEPNEIFNYKKDNDE